MEEKKQNNAPSVAQMELDVLKFWQEAAIFEKTLSKDSPKGDYVFYDGPPFATGTPHYGHLVGSIMKDVVPRFATMRGHHVDRKWGWDCHGLPIENIVEKELGTKTKKDIEAIGIAKFNDLCRDRVSTYIEEWKKTISRLGRFVDMENSYRTMDLPFMESIWWAFKQLWDKGLIYKDYRSMHICPRCETTLSQSEVSEGYKDVKDLSATAKFKLKGGEVIDGKKITDNTFILAWTTTPWTLIGNVALAVGEEIKYVMVKTEDAFYILAKERVSDSFKDKPYEIVSEFEGFDLIGKSYEPLFDYYAKDENLANRENGWKIYGADFVTTEDGVGVVHIAPAFGEDDMSLGKARNLPFIQHVGMDGVFAEEVIDFKGLHVKPLEDHMTTDIEIIKNLAGRSLLFHKEKYEHSYPHCWRCDTPLINYATSSWFISVTKIKPLLLESAKKINWSPDYLKEGRFGNWLEGARDWSISRQRFWASCIPIWECSCGERKVVGSVAELEGLSGEKVNDIHKDKIDHIEFACPKCESKMKRIPDVLDCWFESGSMPYAQLHYPFENEEKFKASFPADFIAEGVDQTRTWFYYLHVIAGGIMSEEEVKHAFKNVVANGIVLAEDGKKMSKKLKNYPDPNLVMEKYGADALRAYLISSPVILAENLNFSEKGVEESLRKNLMLLWNVYKFYEMFATESSDLDLSNVKIDSKNVLDIWINTRLTILIREVENSLDPEKNNTKEINLPRAMRLITEFIDELSTWYLRRSRDRFKSDDAEDRKNALVTTKNVLSELAKVMAPFMPFMAENLWQKVNGYNFNDANKSVHLESWSNLPVMNKDAEEIILDKMDLVRQIVAAGLARRDEAGIKIRQMLGSARAAVRLSDREEENVLEGDYFSLITDELNIQSIDIIFLPAGDANFIDGAKVKVELDTVITPELKMEGIKRELVRSINMIRKDLGLNRTDSTKIILVGEDEEILTTISLMKEDIMKETASSSLEFVPEAENSSDGKEIKINGNKLSLILA